MENKPVFHYAFKTNYPSVVRELKTDVFIAQPSFINSNLGKQFYMYKAIWDTGATDTVITYKIIDFFQLKPFDQVLVQCVNGPPIKKNVYFIDLRLPNDLIFIDYPVIEGDLFDQEIDLLIGMDIIQRGDFAISNGNGKTLFSYCTPSHKEPIDLVEKSNLINSELKNRGK